MPLKWNPFTNSFDWVNDVSGFASSAFKTIQTDAGTYPVADSSTDTLTVTSSDGTITITGDASTDSINLQVNAALAGNVDGPASSTDNAVARFDGTTGKIIQNSGVTVDDSGNITANNLSGTNTGNVTLAGENYLSISGQQITAEDVSLTSNVTGTLPIANGGTNNSSAYTSGSVIFSSGTALTQDNANLFFNNSTNQLGVGTNSPSSRLTVAAETGVLTPPNAVSIDFVLDADPLFTADGSERTFIVFAYVDSGAINDLIGASFYQVDPNDAQGYRVDLVWSAGDGYATGYYLYDALNDQYINVGDVTSISLFGTTAWDPGFPPTGGTSTFYVPSSLLNGGAKLRAGAAQPGNIFETQDDNGNVLISMFHTREGGIQPSLKFTNEFGEDARIGVIGTGNAFIAHESGKLLRIEDPSVGLGTIVSGVAAVGSASVISATQLSVICTATTNKAISVKGAASQSANLQEWLNSSSAILANITKDGAFVFNEQGLDADCRIEGDTDANLFYTDAGNSRVGIGTATPGSKLDVVGSFQCDSITNDTGLAAGTYTPTRSAESNLDSNVTMSEAQYLRVGNTVTVSGRFTADPTAAGAASFQFTLPVASNLGAVEDCAGVAFAGGIAGQGAAISGSVANNTAVVSWIAVDTTSQAWSYNFSYQVI